jgi:hypothetical protein
LCGKLLFGNVSLLQALVSHRNLLEVKIPRKGILYNFELRVVRVSPEINSRKLKNTRGSKCSIASRKTRSSLSANSDINWIVLSSANFIGESKNAGDAASFSSNTNPNDPNARPVSSSLVAWNPGKSLK